MIHYRTRFSTARSTRLTRSAGRFFAAFAVAVLLVATTGCVPEHLATDPQRLERGKVIVLPGIEGPSIWNHELVAGLADGGINCAIERYEWGTSIPGGALINLADLPANRRKAGQLAQHIVKYQERYPGRPVVLVGHSGGAGMALLALERLPADVKVEAAFLLAAAVGPSFDTGPAREHLSGALINCYSRHDALLLGLGTSIFGTVDREFGFAAGAVGFQELAPRASSRSSGDVAPLQQVEWTPSFIKLGNIGQHESWTNRYFVRKWLAPRVKDHLGN